MITLNDASNYNLCFSVWKTEVASKLVFSEFKNTFIPLLIKSKTRSQAGFFNVWFPHLVIRADIDKGGNPKSHPSTQEFGIFKSCAHFYSEYSK